MLDIEEIPICDVLLFMGHLLCIIPDNLAIKLVCFSLALFQNLKYA